MQKKNKIILIVLNVVLVFILNAFAFGANMQTGNYYYKATVPYLEEDLRGINENLYQFIGVDVWENQSGFRKTLTLTVMIEGGTEYGSRPQPALVGDIEDTDDSKIKNVICVWRDELDYETFSSRYGRDCYTCFYIGNWDGAGGGIDYSLEKAHFSANHADYNVFPNREAILPLDSAYYEEISKDEYNRYITKDASVLAINSRKDSSSLELNTNNNSYNSQNKKSSTNQSKRKYSYNDYASNENDNYSFEEDEYFTSKSTLSNQIINDYRISGWHLATDGWRYFDKNTGKALSGWQKIDGDWYYFMPGNCVMQSNTVIDGYFVGFDGKWIPLTR